MKMRGEPLSTNRGVRGGVWGRLAGCGGVLALVALVSAGCGSGGGPVSAKPYPLDTCLVSGEKLGGHGPAYSFVHEGQEIKLCCRDCLGEFQKAPGKYLARLSGDSVSGVSAQGR